MKKNKLKKTMIIIAFILITLSTSYIVYAVSLLSGLQGKEDIAILLFAIIIVMIWICAVASYLKALKKPKSKYKIIFGITLIYSILISLVAYYISINYSSLDNMSSDSTSYSSSIVTFSDNKVDSIKDIKDGTLGILSDSTSIVGNQLPLEIIEKNKLTGEVLEYDGFVELIQALLDKEVEYAFLPTNYEIMSNFEGTGFSGLADKTKTIYSQTKKIKNTGSKNSKLDKPFTILLMGVDSELENISNASFNGDSLMLITFNPNTLSSTILSIPRDTYVPIACFAGNKKNKITHAAWYGEECMINTIQNYTGINIDYYVKINFKGVVKLVDTLGGIEVDVPYAFCEQNSNREWGKNTVYVEEGLQTLNGEQALAFARNRHSWPNYCSRKYTNYISNDFIRGQHQQTVVKGLLNKLKNIRSLNTVTELANTIGNNMETNMSMQEIKSLYNIAKDILVKSNGENVTDLVSMQRLYLNGYDANIYEPTMGAYLYNYVAYDASLEKIVEAMKINLGLTEPTMDKQFSFSIDVPYTEKVIGKDVVGTASVTKLPDFTGDSETQAKSTCNKLGISVSFKYVTTGTGTNNTVISQNYQVGNDISNVKSLVLTILKKEETKSETTVQTEKPTTQTTPKAEETKKPTTQTTDDPEETQNSTPETTTEKDPDDVTPSDVTGIDITDDKLKNE